MVVAALALSGAAQAQQKPIELLQGPTALQPCLDEEVCEGILLELVSETLLEFGFFLQHDALAGSALIGRGTGLTFELHADTYDLGRRNLITEEVVLPPALPKLEVGYSVGSFTFDDPYPQLAVSAFLFPPIPVDGYRLISTGFTGSAAVPVYEHYLWLGAEAGLTYGNVSGEMLGDGSDLEDVESVSPFIDLEPPPCASTDQGCLDRVRQVGLFGRVGVTVEPVPEFFVFAKVGATRLSTNLEIAYDTSRWRQVGLQPAASYGLGVRIQDRVTLALGGVTAAKPEALSTDDSRSVTRLHFGLSVRTGDRRYWFDDAPPEGVPGVKPTE